MIKATHILKPTANVILNGVKWKSLSYVRLFAIPWTVQPMEFSRPEYWSGLPFPSPEDLPNPGIEARSPMFQEDSLPGEPQGKPKNTGVSSLSLLEQIFLTASNQGLLHCRRILYQLSYQGRPSGVKLKEFPLRLGTSVPLSMFLFNTVLKVWSKWKWVTKEALGSPSYRN